MRFFLIVLLAVTVAAEIHLINDLQPKLSLSAENEERLVQCFQKFMKISMWAMAAFLLLSLIMAKKFYEIRYYVVVEPLPGLMEKSRFETEMKQNIV